MSCYTKNRMIDLKRWTTPTPEYIPARWDIGKIILYPKSVTLQDVNERWTKASKYLMGEDTAK